MATRIYSQEEIELLDGTEITLRPLPIGRLRKFMKAWQEFANVKDEDDAFTVYINCCGFCLVDSLGANLENKPISVDGVLSDEYRDALEDVLEMSTIFKILEICGGLNFNDPKLLEATEKAIGTN